MQAYTYAPIIVRPQGRTKPFFQATLPLPPSVNNSHVPVPRYINGRHSAAMVSSSELVTFKRDAALLLPSQSWVDHSILSAIRSAHVKEPLTIHFNFYKTRKWRSGDVDNRVKHAQDAVFVFLGLDDDLINFMSAMRLVDTKNPRVEIEISCFVG